MNAEIQNKLTARGVPLFEGKYGAKFYANDRIIQTSNNYDLGVMNGEIGSVIAKSKTGLSVSINNEEKTYKSEDIDDLVLSFAISIHKSQGSEYSGVIIPISSEHSFMLNRSLIYTAITRGKSKVCLIGEKSVLKRTLQNGFKGSRYTGLNIELRAQGHQKNISLSRLTEVYRQKKNK